MKESGALQRSKESAPLKLVTFEELFDRMQEIYDSIARRAFEIFEGRGRVAGYDFDDWLKAESELLRPIHLDLGESDEAFTVRAEVPGFNANQIEVSVEPRRVTISGKREDKEERKTEKTIYMEQRANRIFRVIELPTVVESAKVTATLKDGILELTLPKAAKPAKIRVQTKTA